MAVSNIAGSNIAAQRPVEETPASSPSSAVSGLKDVAQGIALTALGVPPPLAGIIGQVQNAVIGAVPEGPGKDLVKFLFDPIGSILTLLLGGAEGPDANKGYAAEAPLPPPPPSKSTKLEDKQHLADALDTIDQNFEIASHADVSVDEYADYKYGVSEDDLRAIVSGEGFSPELKEAAAYLLDHREEFLKMTGKPGGTEGSRRSDVPSLSQSELKGARETLKAQISRLEKEADVDAPKARETKAEEPKAKAETSGTSKTENSSSGDHLENAAAKFESAAERIEARMDEVSAMMDKLGPDGKYTEPPPSGKVWTTNSLNAEMTKLSNRYQTVMSQVNALNTLISNVSKMYSDMQMNSIRHIQ